MENTMTTRQALQLIKLLNVMNIKDSLIKTIRDISKLEKEKKIVLQELLKKKKTDDEVNDDTVSRLLQENPEIAKKYADIESENEEMTLNFILDFIFSLTNHEEKFYETISDITGKSIDDVKNEDVTVTVKNLIDMFKSPQFVGFFKLVMK
ncbi:MAG: hypothetical protein ACI3VR_01580 [Intestinibacter sp.]|uniref:hypothetical protein n=1 Tax=Intestinibacter sp. TaxID=1965304 RepID=UPI003F168CF1